MSLWLIPVFAVGLAVGFFLCSAWLIVTFGEFFGR
jgi:phosphate/sulfate permease